MANKVKVWFDAEGDFLEVRFSDDVGYMKETDNEAVMERLDEQGKVIGFSIMQVSRLTKQKPLVADLLPAAS
ncbi:MAG: hypothetical protein ACI8QI_000782 [Limisphaerales bacterium]|jgi:uncharacterized protein YuzE